MRILQAALSGSVYKGFWNQSFAGLFICGVIVVFTVAYFLAAYYISHYYKKLCDVNAESYLKQSNGKEDSKMPLPLRKIRAEFILIAKDPRIENINTQAIISRHLPSRLIFLESCTGYVSGLVIVLGLFGTFYGLTGALGNFNGVIDSVSRSDMDRLVNSLRDPLSSMATAFYTSIFGIIASVGINLLGNIPGVAYMSDRRRFFDVTENVLDNYLLSNCRDKTQDMSGALDLMTENITKTLGAISKEITGAFQEGFDKFNKLEEVSIKINDTGKVLKNSMNTLDKGIQRFEKSMKPFQEGIDRFNTVMDTKVDGVQQAIGQMKEAFSENTGSIDSFSKNAATLSEGLLEIITALKESYEYVSSVLKNTEQSDRDIAKTANDLNSVSMRISNEIAHMSDMFGKQLRYSLSLETTRIAEEIVILMRNVMEDARMRNQELEEVADQLKRRIAALQQAEVEREPEPLQQAEVEREPEPLQQAETEGEGE